MGHRARSLGKLFEIAGGEQQLPVIIVPRISHATVRVGQ